MLKFFENINAAVGDITFEQFFGMLYSILIGLIVLIIVMVIWYVTSWRRDDRKEQKRLWQVSIQETKNCLPLTTIKQLYFQPGDLIKLEKHYVIYDGQKYHLQDFKQFKKYTKWQKEPIPPKDVELKQLGDLFQSLYEKGVITHG